MAESAQPTAGAHAPGSRVHVRGEEWVVDRCLPVPTGGWSVYVTGLSELVRHHKAIFLTAIDGVSPLRPEDTDLVEDDSPAYRQTRLFLETLLRRTPPTDAHLYLGHHAAIDVMPFQLTPARKALQNLRQRILVADGVGLGKTIEVGILLSELIKRGRGRRILVVAIKSMLAQFQQELWARFTIPLVRLDSEGIQRVQSKIPSNKNPFSHYDRAIVSVDTLKNNARYRAWLEQTRWDAIVVDECHNVANRGSQREALARLLAATCDTLVLTSATPHNGRPESFANLMNMLDPSAVADPHEFDHEDVAHLFVRRFKKDIEAEAGRSFSERALHRHEIRASADEDRALEALRDFTTNNLGRKQHGPDRLFRWVLIKAFLSSPHACLESIDARTKRIDQALEPEDGRSHPHAAALLEDRARLEELRPLVARCAEPRAFGKLERLVEELRAIGFDGTAASPRVIVFSERLETLRTLRAELGERFDLEDARVAVFEASLEDVKQKELVDSFGKRDSRLRLLLASDVASEGVNLHYFCHELFHFDVPWSLIRLEQRMGRIDRFGQHETPHLHYLLLRSTAHARAADEQIVDRLIDKEEQVHRQLGEAGVVLGLYDAQAEDDYLTKKLAEGATAEEAIPDRPLGHNPEAATDEGEPAPGMDLYALFDEVPPPASEPVAEATRASVTLFASDYDFAKQGLVAVQDHPVTGEERLTWDSDDAHRLLRMWPPEGFVYWRQPFLPAEALPAPNDPWRLTADRALVQKHIEQAREREGEWPSWHLLWEQNPVVEWLLDALGAVYARNAAPVVRAPRLGARRAVFLFQALLYNERSQPVLAEWLGIPLRWTESETKHWESPMQLPELLELTGFDAGLVNAGDPIPERPLLQAAVPDAVAHARAHALALYNERLNPLRQRVREAQRRLEKWKTKRLALLDARASHLARTAATSLHERRLADERATIARFAADHEAFIQGLTKRGDPYIRLAAVFTGGER